MLTGMDIPLTAGPWLVLGVVLGALLPVLAALGVRAVRRRDSATEAPSPSPATFGVDDLPAFLESPPGSTLPPVAPEQGWAALSSPAVPAEARVPRRKGYGSTDVLAAMAVTALLLVGAAAVVAAAGTGGAADDRSGQWTSAAPRPGTAAALLTFEGIVVERHAVGVTVAYPHVALGTDGDRATVELELPTFNCLRVDAPEDPVAAGCTRSVPEYARLSAPELAMEADPAGLRLSGRFATERRPNGSLPSPTGRVYELTVSAFPRDGRAGAEREPAGGVLEVAGERVDSSDEGPNEISYAG
jgi:hypothetical protein